MQCTFHLVSACAPVDEPSPSSEEQDQSRAELGYEFVRVLARFCIAHLVNYIGHFPLQYGFSRSVSLLREYSDLDAVEPKLTEALFRMPNSQVRIFADQSSPNKIIYEYSV